MCLAAGAGAGARPCAEAVVAAHAVLSLDCWDVGAATPYAWLLIMAPLQWVGLYRLVCYFFEGSAKAALR